MIRIGSGFGTSKTKMVTKKGKNVRVFIENFGKHGILPFRYFSKFSQPSKQCRGSEFIHKIELRIRHRE
jgi:hypothetical protein